MIPKLDRNLNFILKLAVRICKRGCDITHIFLYICTLRNEKWRIRPVNCVTSNQLQLTR